VGDVATAMPAITQVLQQRGVNVIAVRPYVATFDEVFMTIVSEHAQKSHAHR
jgi:hypothetical protein